MADPFAIDALDDDTEDGSLRRLRKGGSTRRGWVSFLIELPILIMVALIVAIVIKTFFFQAFFIPSRSMVPTLMVDDRVMVNKLSYKLNDPDRGDIIVLDNPFAPPSDGEPLLDKVVRSITESLGIRPAAVPDDLIKRVVGLPGETIEVKENQVWINGVPLDEPWLEPGVFMGDEPPLVVPNDSVFIMGDNRSESLDSRRFGPVPLDSIIGRAFVILWPSDRWGGL